MVIQERPRGFRETKFARNYPLAAEVLGLAGATVAVAAAAAIGIGHMYAGAEVMHFLAGHHEWLPFDKLGLSPKFGTTEKIGAALGTLQGLTGTFAMMWFVTRNENATEQR